MICHLELVEESVKTKQIPHAAWNDISLKSYTGYFMKLRSYDLSPQELAKENNSALTGDPLPRVSITST